MLDLSSLKAAIYSLDNALSVAGNREYMMNIPLNVRELIEAGVI